MCHSSVMKGRPLILTGDGQQTHLPRAELGRSDHRLDEFYWRRAVTGAHDGSVAILVLEEDLFDLVTVCEGVDMSDGHLPLIACYELEQCARRPTGAVRVRA